MSATLDARYAKITEETRRHCPWSLRTRAELDHPSWLGLPWHCSYRWRCRALLRGNAECRGRVARFGPAAEVTASVSMLVSVATKVDCCCCCCCCCSCCYHGCGVYVWCLGEC